MEQAVPDATALARFYELLEETARRNEFTIEPFSYYEDFMRHLVDEAILLFARTERGVVAGLIMTCFGHEAIYHFAASSTTLRVPGATAYLNFQAMRLARAYGCTRYDMWGIPDEDRPPEGDPSRSRGGDWQGVLHFKLSFGGNIVSYPPPLERRYPARRSWTLWRRS